MLSLDTPGIPLNVSLKTAKSAKVIPSTILSQMKKSLALCFTDGQRKDSSL